MRRPFTWLGLLLGLLLSLVGPASAQVTQCVSTAIAGGTPDALTIPLLPCSPTSTLLVLTLTGTNITTTPTLSVISASAPQVIQNAGGGALSVGQLTSGQRVLLNYNGQNWFLLTQGTIAGLGTAAYQNIGTSGANLGLLNANKTDSGNNTFTGQNVMADTYFSSGRPWADILAFGCKVSVTSGFPGNGTDNTTCAQAAINAQEALYGTS